MQTRGVWPDASTFSAAISVCWKSEQWQWALNLLDEMQQSGAWPDAIPFSDAVSSCDKTQAWQAALQLCAKIWQMRIRSDVIGNPTESNSGQEPERNARINADEMPPQEQPLFHS